MADKLGFLDSLFDINGDGKVDFMDMAEEAFILDAMEEEERQESGEEDFDDFDLSDDDELEEALEEAREEKRAQMLDLGLDPDEYSDEELDELDDVDIELMADETEDYEAEYDEEETSELDDLDEEIYLTVHDENATLLNFHWAGINMLRLFVDKAKERIELSYDYGDQLETYGFVWTAILYTFISGLEIDVQRKVDLYDCLLDKLALDISGVEAGDLFVEQKKDLKDLPFYLDGVLQIVALADMVTDCKTSFSDYVRVFQALSESASEDCVSQYPEVGNQAIANMLNDLGTAAWERAQKGMNKQD